MASLVHVRASDLLDPDQAAAYAGVEPVTIRQWKHRGLLAPAIPGDGHRTRHLYAKSDIDTVKLHLAQAEVERATTLHTNDQPSTQPPAPATAYPMHTTA
jgi:DNA-binding transcriptional MerR regulator